jgi:hypothetical protein
MNVKVLDFNNEFEAKLLDEILNERNIPHLIRSYPEEFREELLLIYSQMSPESLED